MNPVADSYLDQKSFLTANIALHPPINRKFSTLTLFPFSVKSPQIEKFQKMRRNTSVTINGNLESLDSDLILDWKKAQLKNQMYGSGRRFLVLVLLPSRTERQSKFRC